MIKISNKKVKIIKVPLTEVIEVSKEKFLLGSLIFKRLKIYKIFFIKFKQRYFFSLILKFL